MSTFIKNCRIVYHKIFCGCLLGVAMVALALLTGCAAGPKRFANKHAYLLGSRRVGCCHQEFENKPCVKYDFNSKEEMKNFQIVNGKWQIQDAKLWAVKGKHNRSILLAKNVRSPFRIAFEATNYANPDGSIGDITVLINTENSNKFFSRGYALTTGSFYNNCSTFYRRGKPIVKTEYSPLVSGKTYKVIIEYVDSHIRYWLDNEIILEAWEPQPLEFNPELWIGIRTYNTRMSIDNFEVYNGMKMNRTK